MDQVPLPFVNGQGETFTNDDNKDVNLKSPKESLCKRQFTMHLVFNSGVGYEGYGWCDLVCGGKGVRISAGEKAMCSGNINLFWQEKAWVDKHVMRELARKFVAHKNEAHGENVWVILFCDNRPFG